MSYDMIDRFLRNNLGDDDYAEYSAALDSLCVLQRKPLTDEEIRKVKHHMVDGAYQYSFMQGVRYAEAAHGIKGDT